MNPIDIMTWTAAVLVVILSLVLAGFVVALVVCALKDIFTREWRK